MWLLKNDGRRREKLGICRLGVGHGRAKLLEFCGGWQGMGWHGRAKLLASQAQKIFSSFS